MSKNAGMLVLMCGICGSGKTQLSQYLVDHKGLTSIIRISSDELRAVIGKGEGDQGASKKVFQVMRYMTTYFLKDGYTVIIDALNYRPKNRKDFINIARELNVEVMAYCLDIPFEVCMERNKNRERVVPESVLLRQRDNLEWPTESEVDSIMWVRE